MRIKGGLGNQLFQYAAGYSLAKRLGQELLIDSSFYPTQALRGYKLPFLAIDYTTQVEQLPINFRIEKNKYINKLFRILDVRKFGINNQYLLETRSEIMQDFFTINKPTIYLDGYYQSEKYFIDYREELLAQFVPNYSFEPEYIEAKKHICETNAIAVHVRRGDFVETQGNSNPNRYVLDDGYYKKCIQYIQTHIEKPYYMWFSDDIEWVKKNFGDAKDSRFISLNTTHPDIDEMMLMTECKHIITANSTFSWWAAWMKKHDGIILCPQKRYGNIEMIPSSWIKM